MLALPPIQMPLPPAEIVPELLMPPEKVEIVTDAAFLRSSSPTMLASPPTQRPLPVTAVIVPALTIPPEKVVIVTDAVFPAE